MGAHTDGGLQRWTRSDPCRICGGHEGDKRGKGERCYGFLSSDREYAHCTREDLAVALSPHRGGDTYAHRLVGDCRCGKTHGGEPASSNPPPTRHNAKKREQAASPAPTPARFASSDEVVEHYKRVGVYERGEHYDYETHSLYCDERGEEVLLVVRFERDEGEGRDKTFRQAAPRNGGWALSSKGARLVPYKLGELLDGIKAGYPVYVVEGEKDVEAVRKAGGVSTCNPMGAGKDVSIYADHFRGASRVVVVADADEPGRKHAENWRQALKGVAERVEVVESVAGNDASDALDTHGLTLAEAFRFPPPPIDTSRFVHVGADRYAKLRRAPEPEWLVDSLLRIGKTTVLGGNSMAGKTWAALQIGSSVAAGEAVWPGAPERAAPGLVVYIGSDPHMSVEDVARRLYHFDTGAHRKGQGFAPGSWVEHFVTVGHSEQDGPFPVDRYRLDEGGCERLADEVLRPIERERGPIKLIVLDTLSTALPEGCDENSNPAMNAVITRFSMLALEFKAAGLALHHPTKASTASGDRFNSWDWSSYFRGASAIPAAAGVVAGLWAPAAYPSHRVLTAWSNSGAKKRTWFEVAGPDRGAAGLIDYWLAVDPQDGGAAGRHDEAETLEALAEAFAEAGPEGLSWRGFVQGTQHGFSGAARERAEKLLEWTTGRGWTQRDEAAPRKVRLTHDGARAVAPYREAAE